MNAADYFVEFSRDTTAQCGGCYNDQYYTESGQSTPKAVHVTPGGVVSNINATFVCGKPARYFIRMPVVAR